jgi:hypothetical protein
MEAIKKQEVREIRPERIDMIIKNYRKEELVPSAKAWELWSASFFNKVDMLGKCVTFINRLRERNKTNNRTLTEQDFQELFPELKYNIPYIDPMEFNSFNISYDEINRIAMLLQEELNTTWEESVHLVKSTFRGNDWSYNGMYRIAGCVNSRLKALLFTKKMINNLKKVS